MHVSLTSSLSSRAEESSPSPEWLPLPHHHWGPISSTALTMLAHGPPSLAAAHQSTNRDSQLCARLDIKLNAIDGPQQQSYDGNVWRASWINRLFVGRRQQQTPAAF